MLYERSFTVRFGQVRRIQLWIEGGGVDRQYLINMLKISELDTYGLFRMQLEQYLHWIMTDGLG